MWDQKHSYLETVKEESTRLTVVSRYNSWVTNQKALFLKYEASDWFLQNYAGYITVKCLWLSLYSIPKPSFFIWMSMFECGSSRFRLSWVNRTKHLHWKRIFGSHFESCFTKLNVSNSIDLESIRPYFKTANDHKCAFEFRAKVW